jgi:hypothetical protein
VSFISYYSGYWINVDIRSPDRDVFIYTECTLGGTQPKLIMKFELNYCCSSFAVAHGDHS